MLDAAQAALRAHASWLLSPHALQHPAGAFASAGARAAACAAAPGGACARSAAAAASGAAGGFFAGDPAGVWRVFLLNWSVQFFCSWMAFAIYMVRGVFCRRRRPPVRAGCFATLLVVPRLQVWDYRNWRAGIRVTVTASKDDLAKWSHSQGITTAILGEGSSPAPVNDKILALETDSASKALRICYK